MSNKLVNITLGFSAAMLISSTAMAQNYGIQKREGRHYPDMNSAAHTMYGERHYAEVTEQLKLPASTYYGQQPANAAPAEAPAEAPADPYVETSPAPATAPAQAMPMEEEEEEVVEQDPYVTAPPGEPTIDYIPPVLPNYIEAGINYHDVSNDQGNWRGEYLRTEIQSDAYNRWNFDLLHQEAFNDNGIYAALGNTHQFNENWFTDITVGTSTSNAFFLPRVRVDAFLNRRWLPGKNFITTIGGGYYKAKDSHKDGSLFLGTTYYFDSPWILQNGVRFNWSAPGGVFSANGFLALTQGSYKNYFLTARVDYGNEAYQIIGPGNALSDFKSKTASLTWKQWLDVDWGFNMRGEYYHNPNYHRAGGSAGVFMEF